MAQILTEWLFYLWYFPSRSSSNCGFAVDIFKSVLACVAIGVLLSLIAKLIFDFINNLETSKDLCLLPTLFKKFGAFFI